MVEKIELGKYTIAEKWEDVKLKQWQEYLRKTDENEDKKIDIITLLEIFSDIPKDVINQMPTELFEKVISRMTFLNEDVSKIEPDNKIIINDETYLINTLEKLKVKEYLDVTTILENDKFNYSALFAVLCRKPNETYDDDFVADKLGDRIEMFENANALDALKLIGFFLTLYLRLGNHLANSSMVATLKTELEEAVHNIESSLKVTDFIFPSKVRQIFRLKKVKKSLKKI